MISSGGKRRAAVKTSIKSSEGGIVGGTVGRTTTGGPYWIGAGIYNAVGEDEVSHLWICSDLIADDKQGGWRESCNMIDRHASKDWAMYTHGDLCKFTGAVVLHAVDVVYDHIVNAVTLAGQRGPSIIRQAVCQHACPPPTWLMES